MSQIVVADEGTDDLSFISGSAVGNFVGFQPGTGDRDAAIALGNMQYLQGGNDVAVGPIDSTSAITPSTSSPPDYLGFISLPYHPDAAPLDVTSPSYFLSVTPALMQQSASGFSYQQSGSIITGWQLLDRNNNPIAQSTLQDLFGVPRGRSRTALRTPSARTWRRWTRAGPTRRSTGGGITRPGPRTPTPFRPRIRPAPCLRHLGRRLLQLGPGHQQDTRRGT